MSQLNHLCWFSTVVPGHLPGCVLWCPVGFLCTWQASCTSTLSLSKYGRNYEFLCGWGHNALEERGKFFPPALLCNCSKSEHCGCVADLKSSEGVLTHLEVLGKWLWVLPPLLSPWIQVLCIHHWISFQYKYLTSEHITFCKCGWDLLVYPEFHPKVQSPGMQLHTWH